MFATRPSWRSRSRGGRSGISRSASRPNFAPGSGDIVRLRALSGDARPNIRLVELRAGHGREFPRAANFWVQLSGSSVDLVIISLSKAAGIIALGLGLGGSRSPPTSNPAPNTPDLVPTLAPASTQSLAGLDPHLVEAGLNCVEIVSVVVELSPECDKRGHMWQASLQFWPHESTFGRRWPNYGRHRPNLVDGRPTGVRLRQLWSNSLRHGLSGSQSGRRRPKVGRARPEFAPARVASEHIGTNPIRPTSAQFWSHTRQILPEVDPTRVECCSDLVQPASIWSKSTQI